MSAEEKKARKEALDYLRKLVANSAGGSSRLQAAELILRYTT